MSEWAIKTLLPSSRHQIKTESMLVIRLLKDYLNRVYPTEWILNMSIDYKNKNKIQEF